MKVLSVIFGIITTIFGILFMVTPLRTAFGLNIYIMILVLVYGIIGIISGIVYKYFGVGFVFSILSVIFGILMLCFPSLIVLTDIIILYMVAAWIILQGIVTVIASIRVSKLTDSKKWIIELIVGILGIIIGIYSFIHPAVFGFTLTWIIGLLIGAYFVQTGLSLIFFSPKSE